uniref:Uncharacterized protein n=1 Tax=Anguilla anguilla TaxID=7936 RepID=A0A0E9R6Y2_ANGAN
MEYLLSVQDLALVVSKKVKNFSPHLQCKIKRNMKFYSIVIKQCKLILQKCVISLLLCILCVHSLKCNHIR